MLVLKVVVVVVMDDFLNVLLVVVVITSAAAVHCSVCTLDRYLFVVRVDHVHCC